MTKKAYVLLSGGLDSTTCLYKAIKDYMPLEYELTTMPYEEHIKTAGVETYWVEAVSIDYGQRHRKEVEYAERTCKKLGIKHSVISLKGLLGDVMLTNSDIEIPDVDYSELEGVSPTYVPFRNGTMLSAITAKAQAHLYASKIHDEDAIGIYFGAHAEDAFNWAYPDCTPEFIGAMANAIYIGTYRQVRLHTPLMSLSKTEIVELGAKLGVPFEETWSCYKGLEKQCGVCPTCRSRRNAFKIASIIDPTEYLRDPPSSEIPF